jgi:hypothetical protein
MCSMGCALYIRCALSKHHKECQKSLGCALSTGKYGTHLKDQNRVMYDPMDFLAINVNQKHE